jgi:hypothetical protein
MVSVCRQAGIQIGLRRRCDCVLTGLSATIVPSDSDPVFCVRLPMLALILNRSVRILFADYDDDFLLVVQFVTDTLFSHIHTFFFNT